MQNADDVPESLKAAEAFDHLAGECLCHGRRDEAVDYHRRALAVRERVLGPDHWEVANSLVILSGVLEWDDAHPEAELLTRRAADIYERIVGRLDGERGELSEHAFRGLLGVLGNLAGTAWRRGDLEAAETKYREVLDRFERHYGRDSGYIHPTLPGFARLLVRRNKPDEAEALLRAALVRTGWPATADGWDVADCEEALAELCVELGRVSDAEGLYRMAVVRRERIAANGWPASAEAAARTLHALARVYREAGRTDEADDLEQRASEWARRRAEAMPWDT